jgi:hypothetical protein
MNTKQKIIRLFVILLLCFFALSCKKDSDNPVEPIDNIPKIQATGKIELPSNLNPNNYKITAGLNQGNISNGNYNIKLNQNAVQMVSVVDQNNSPILLSVDVVGGSDRLSNINAQTTAEALVFLNPMFCSSSSSIATELKQKILSLSSFNSLVNLINTQLQSNSFQISESNTQLQQKLGDLYKELYTSIPQRSLGKTKGLKSVTDFILNPNIEVNGLKINELAQSSSNVSFKVANSAKRWISVFVDKSKDGSNYEYDSEWFYLIPSTNISIWNILTKGALTSPENTSTINVTTTGYKNILVKCYGLGASWNLNDREFSRMIVPGACSAVFDLILPMFNVMTGLDLVKDLRGRPADHPFYKLVNKVATGILTDAAKKGQFIKWYQEGDIVKILADMTKSIFDTCIKEPTYIADILTQVAGTAVARALVDSWLFPLRIVNGVFTVANLTYAVVSVASSEAVTTFSLENNPVALPISVEGIVKDFSTSQGISGASISVSNANGTLITTIRSDNTGKFIFNCNPGSYSLRIFATGFKPLDQNITIPQDILTQTNKTFTVPISWLSVFSSQTGNINGLVRNATNLIAISGVNIVLRFGVNDPTKDIIATTTSASNGSFTFSNIPSGTYTAYFSKTGYISDYLVIPVLGNNIGSSLTMNLSPDIRTTSGYRIILTWGADPRDIDSHLFTPTINGNKYHIYWNNKGDLTRIPYANLDVDDRYSYGPETITIVQTFSGTYYYSVHHYEGVGSLTTSNAIVNLYGVNGFIRSWSVPISGSGFWWNVFSIDGITGLITNINQISSSSPSYNLIMNAKEEHLKNEK